METRQTKAQKTPMEKLQTFEGDEHNRNIILAVRLWNIMSETEQNRTWGQWKQYYDVCDSSEPAHVYRDLRDAYRKHDWATFKSFVQQARSMKEEYTPIPKPQCIDPYWFHNNQGVFIYRGLLESVEKWKKELEAKPEGVNQIFA